MRKRSCLGQKPELTLDILLFCLTNPNINKFLWLYLQKKFPEPDHFLTASISIILIQLIFFPRGLLLLPLLLFSLSSTLQLKRWS